MLFAPGKSGHEIITKVCSLDDGLSYRKFYSLSFSDRRSSYQIRGSGMRQYQSIDQLIRRSIKHNSIPLWTCPSRYIRKKVPFFQDDLGKSNTPLVLNQSLFADGVKE